MCDSVRPVDCLQTMCESVRPVDCLQTMCESVRPVDYVYRLSVNQSDQWTAYRLCVNQSDQWTVYRLSVNQTSGLCLQTMCPRHYAHVLCADAGQREQWQEGRTQRGRHCQQAVQQVCLLPHVVTIRPGAPAMVAQHTARHSTLQC